MPETGPIYGVELIDTLPLGTGAMLQAMPSRADLIQARRTSERTVAGYEVLLDAYRTQQKQIAKAVEILSRCFPHDQPDDKCESCGGLGTPAGEAAGLICGACMGSGKQADVVEVD